MKCRYMLRDAVLVPSQHDHAQRIANIDVVFDAKHGVAACRRSATTKNPVDPPLSVRNFLFARDIVVEHEATRSPDAWSLRNRQCDILPGAVKSTSRGSKIPRTPT